MPSLWKIGRETGNAVIRAAKNPNQRWYCPHMAAASRAIYERIPLVDFILEIRDARIPVSSGYEMLRKFASSCLKRIVVLNKMDLADPLESKEWISYFEQKNCLAYAVNSHNKDSVKQFLNFLQRQVREVQRAGDYKHTTTMMLLGIPNVGKSALANSLHQIGRISAAEKGKLKHAIVSPQPGETKDISSLKIGSHPNVYVLDTPGVLPPKLIDAEICSKLALTGAIRDDLVGAEALARYFLTMLNSGDEHKKWAKLSIDQNESPFVLQETECSNGSKLDVRQKRRHPADHTQDFIVHDTRRILYETVSRFAGSLENELDMESLVKLQFAALRKVFQIAAEPAKDAEYKVASKLLNLHRTGRLGHYTLDPAPSTT